MIWSAYSSVDRRYIKALFTSGDDTMERDGPMQYKKHTCYPWSIMDDYGTLIPVDRS
jgi:hypothetical protein